MHSEGSERQNKPSQISLKSLTGPQKALFTDVDDLSLCYQQVLWIQWRRKCISLLSSEISM